MGRRYRFGESGLELSPEKAVDYYKKGTKLGHPKCMDALGYMYEAAIFTTISLSKLDIMLFCPFLTIKMIPTKESVTITTQTVPTQHVNPPSTGSDEGKVVTTLFGSISNFRNP